MVQSFENVRIYDVMRLVTAVCNVVSCALLGAFTFGETAMGAQEIAIISDAYLRPETRAPKSGISLRSSDTLESLGRHVDDMVWCKAFDVHGFNDLREHPPILVFAHGSP